MEDLSQTIGETRICVEKFTPNHMNEVNRIRTKSNSPDHYERLMAAFYTSKIWPKGTTIRCAFMGTGNQVVRTSLDAIQDIRSDDGQPLKMDPLQKGIDEMSVRQAVRKIVRERIQPITGLNFTWVDKPSAAQVRIAFDPNAGAWSLVGTDCLHEDHSKPTMNLAWFDVATVLHEFGHVLGMVHEHDNPDDNPIQWNDARVFAWAAQTQGWPHSVTEKNIIQRYKHKLINGSKFDPLSIMLYFFPAKITLNHVGTHQNLRLSGDDVLYISKMYPGGNVSPQKFYPQVYGEPLVKSIDKSNKLREKDFSESEGRHGKKWKKRLVTIIVPSVVGFLVLIGLVILLVVLLGKKKTRRYGR
jgi:hypothetical protein